jgi:carbonic anhydrase
MTHHCVTHSCHNLSETTTDVTVGRRQFLKLATLGAGVALFMSAAPRFAVASGKAKALMLSCMDYRLVDDTVKFMADQGLNNEYDHLVLAGASLGVVSETFKDWHGTFWQHLDVAIKLHGIEEVIVIDHRDCGAYKLAMGAEAVDTPAKETAVHTATIAAFAKQVKAKHGTLGVKAYIMSLDGKTEAVAV